MSRWVNYEGELALLVAYDESTDLCEIHRLTRNGRTYQGKVTHSLSDDIEVVPYSEVENPPEDPQVTQYFDDLFVLDDGDEDYFPTAEDSGSEISDVSLDDECSSAAESPKRESDVQITENTG